MSYSCLQDKVLKKAETLGYHHINPLTVSNSTSLLSVVLVIEQGIYVEPHSDIQAVLWSCTADCMDGQAGPLFHPCRIEDPSGTSRSPGYCRR